MRKGAKTKMSLCKEKDRHTHTLQMEGKNKDGEKFFGH